MNFRLTRRGHRKEWGEGRISVAWLRFPTLQVNDPD